MTSSFTKSKGAFIASRTVSDEDTRTRDRNAATKEGRQVLALEMIADQLSVIARHLSSMLPSDERPAIDVPRPESDDDLVRDEADLAMHGIKRGSIETFAAGQYTYTNLELAIEEAKRVRRRAAGSVGE